MSPPMIDLSPIEPVRRVLRRWPPVVAALVALALALVLSACAETPAETCAQARVTLYQLVEAERRATVATEARRAFEATLPPFVRLTPAQRAAWAEVRDRQEQAELSAQNARTAWERDRMACEQTGGSIR